MPTGRRKAAPRGGLSGGGPLGLADAPSDFTPAERQIWREIIETAPAGLLQKVDRRMVAMLATVTWLIQRVKGELAAEGLIVPTQRGGARRNPHLLTLVQLTQLQLRLASELGLTPIARRRLNLPQESAPSEFWRLIHGERGGGPKRGGGAVPGPEPPAAS